MVPRLQPVFFFEDLDLFFVPFLFDVEVLFDFFEVFFVRLDFLSGGTPLGDEPAD